MSKINFISPGYPGELETVKMKMERSEIRRVIGVYREKGMNNLAGVIETRIKKLEDVEKWTLLFKEGLYSSDTSKTREALQNLALLAGDNEIILCFDNDEEREALALSLYVNVEKRVRKGEKEINFCHGFFNPFLNSPEDALVLSGLSDGCYYKPITTFVLAVGSFLEDFNALFPDTLKSPMYRYLESWMPGCIDIIRENIEALMSDKEERFYNNDDPDGPDALGDLLSALLDNPSFEKLFDYAYDALKDRLSECIKSYSPNPLYKVIADGNESAFDKLFALDGLEGDCIENYPVDSVYILDKLYERGILLPGTEKGRNAFFDLLTFSNPSREIIKRTMHPSYFDNPNKTPYSVACSNMRFSPSNLDLLIQDEDDINSSSEVDRMPPVSSAIIKNDVERMRSLYFLGADLNWHDGKGNNILHYIFAGSRRHHRDEMENTLKRVFWLRDEKNMCGSTPDDYLNEDDKILEGYERIESKKVWSLIFEKGIGKSADTIIIDEHSYFDPIPYMEKIKVLVKRSTGCSDETIYTIFSDDELEEFYNISRESARSFVTVIHYCDYFSGKSKTMIYDLLSRSNVAVIAIMVSSFNHSLFDALIERGVENVLVGGITTPLESEWYTGRIGAEMLEKGEYIYKHGDEVYIVEKDEKP